MHKLPENILKEYCYEISEQFSDLWLTPSPGVYNDTKKGEDREKKNVLYGTPVRVPPLFLKRPRNGEKMAGTNEFAIFFAVEYEEDKHATTNVQHRFVLFFLFSFLVLELKPFVLKGKVLGEKL